jgi:uncharacterized protein (DUF2062 family)
MKQRIKNWLNTQDGLRHHRWLRWMGPVLHQPRLWHFSRRGIAMGVAVGIFFGLLVPIAQMPLSAAAAVALRANLPMAVASTFVTNPVTFAPVYYGAYRLGKVVLGEPSVTEREAMAELEMARAPEKTEGAKPTWTQRAARGLEHLRTAGKPLAVGLSIIATLSGLLVYGLISGLWILKTRWERKRRLRQRSSPPA